MGFDPFPSFRRHRRLPFDDRMLVLLVVVMSPTRLACSVPSIVTDKDDRSEHDPKTIAGAGHKRIIIMNLLMTTMIAIERRIHGLVEEEEEEEEVVVVEEEEEEETSPGETARRQQLEMVRNDSRMTMMDGVQITLQSLVRPVSGNHGRIPLAPPRRVQREAVSGDDDNHNNNNHVHEVTLVTKAQVAGVVEAVDPNVMMKQKAGPSI